MQESSVFGQVARYRKGKGSAMFTTVKVVRLDSMGRESVEIIEGDLPTVAARVLADDPHGVIELKLV